MISIVTALIPGVMSLLEKVIPDKDAREKLAHEIATQAEKDAHTQIMAQVELNKEEAKHKSIFVAGWRPGVGWVCLIAMASNYIVMPYLQVFGLEVPALDLGQMMPVLLGMLGLGGLRSFEKTKHVARDG